MKDATPLTPPSAWAELIFKCKKTYMIPEDQKNETTQWWKMGRHFTAATRNQLEWFKPVACVHSQRHTNAFVFWLTKLMLCVMMLRNYLFFSDHMSFQMVRQTGCWYVNWLWMADICSCELIEKRIYLSAHVIYYNHWNLLW